jgi:uncharacterized membrane protein
MFKQHTMQQYLSGVADYNYFVWLCLAFGAALAFAAAKSQRKAIRIPDYLSLFVITLFGLLIRIPLLNQGFWFDEAFTSAVVQTSTLSEFFTAILGDVHPPGYYLIIYGLVSIFGYSDVFMRIPALLAGTAMIPAMYKIGCIHGGERVGRWSAIITAVLPAALYYSSEARYPALLALLLALAYIAIQQDHKRLFMWSLTGAALLHVNAWFYIGIAGLIWLFMRRGVFWLIAPALAVACWLPAALIQAADVSDGFWLTHMPPYIHIFEMTLNVRFHHVVVLFVCGVIVMAIILLAGWCWNKSLYYDLKHIQRQNSIYFAFVLAVPLLQWSVGFIWHPVYLPRTLLFSAILLAVPVAWWLDNAPVRWLAGAGAMALVVAIVSLYQYDRPYNADEAVQACSGYSTIYATNTKTAVLARHFSGSDVLVYADGNSTDQSLPDSSRKALFNGIGTLEQRIDSVCVLAKISMFNTIGEMNHIDDLARLYPDHTFIEQGELYFVVMR